MCLPMYRLMEIVKLLTSFMDDSSEEDRTRTTLTTVVTVTRELVFAYNFSYFYCLYNTHLMKPMAEEAVTYLNARSAHQVNRYILTTLEKLGDAV